jgi:hypothetical protein
MDEKKKHYISEEPTEEERRRMEEEYLRQWALVKQTEDMDDEDIVKEYAKIFSQESSNSDSKKNK